MILAVAIAAGVGAALPGIMGQLVSSEEVRPKEAPAEDWLLARSLVGSVERFGATGWRRLQPGVALSLPLRLRTGPGAYLGLSSRGLSLALAEGSELRVGRPTAAGITLDLVTGAVTLTRAEGSAHTRLSGAGVDVFGRSYGLSRRNGQIELSALEGEVSFSAPKFGAELKLDAPGRLLLSRGRVVTGALSDRLEVRPMSSSPRGSSFRFQAMSSAGSQVWIRIGAKYQRVVTNAEGRFTVLIEQEAPAPGQILLRDTLGRVAELNHPSRSLAALLADVRAGQGPAAASEAEPEAPAPEAPVAKAEPPAAPPPAAEPPKPAPRPAKAAAEAEPSPPVEEQAPPPEEGPIEVAPIGDEGEEEEDAERGL